MTFTMLGVGAGILLALFASSAVVSGIYLSGIVPPELTGRILLTMTPWYLAGLAAYFLVAWIITEPTLYMRIIAALITVAVLRMFYYRPIRKATTAPCRCWPGPRSALPGSPGCRYCGSKPERRIDR